MQTDIFDRKVAFRAITERNDQVHLTSAMASAGAQFAWYAIYFVYLPEHRLLLLIWQFLVMLLPILICKYRKKLGLNGAQCQLIAIFFIATLGWCLMNICPGEIRLVVFFGITMLFLGPAFLAFWPFRYYLAVVIFSVILDITYYITVGYLSFSDFIFHNVFPSAITIFVGAFLLNSRVVNLLKKERIKWSMVQTEKELSLMNLKTRAELEFLIYSISHDLRSPILSVKGLLMLIKDFEKLNPESSNYLQMAEGSVDRLDQNIYDILDFANNAKIELKYENFDMGEMVEEIFNDLKFLTKHTINFQIEIEGSEMVYGDKKRLKTIIKNLASNAVKYSRIDAADAFVKFKLRQDNDQIEFQVEDNGIGIPPEQHQKIFDMFYRYANDNNGSGLGLFIVKEVLSKLGGTVKLDSIEGKGSVFKISIPK
jgi:signal transduction histidine kinase